MRDLRKKTCCFSGHRIIPASQIGNIEQRAEKHIRELYYQGVHYFGVGGAIGYDTIMAKLLFRLKKVDLTDLKVILVYPFEGFNKRWTTHQKLLYKMMLPMYDKTVCVAKWGSKEAFLARNRHLINGSAYCIAYCVKSSGGTAYTVQYANARGVTVYNLADEIPMP